MADISGTIDEGADHVQEESSNVRSGQEPHSINLLEQSSPEARTMDPENLVHDTERLSISHDDVGSSGHFLPRDSTVVQSSIHSTSLPEKQIFDPTPRTPVLKSPLSPSPSKQEPPGLEDSEKSMQDHGEQMGLFGSQADAEKSSVQTSGRDVEKEGVSSPEIRNIMDQFPEECSGPDSHEKSASSTKSSTQLLETTMRHPPRQSSLEPIQTSAMTHTQDSQQGSLPTQLPSQVPRSPSHGHVNSVASHNFSPTSPFAQTEFHNHELSSSGRSPSIQRVSLPEPDPEPDLPFDFHRFLEQLRHRSADPVAKFLRSFLMEFGKKQWMAHEQVKIIGDFLAFIANKMAQCEVWQGVSEAEFDNAREGMEKLVMNRLYTQTFSPAIPPPPHSMTDEKGKRRHSERSSGPGRRGQHQEDVERDIVLAQKMRIYQWVREEHLDLQPVSDSGRKFLNLAQQELLKINSYRAPRDKVICALNSCKVIFGFLRNAKSDQSADSFVPLLIYVVLHANPEHLVSNVQYILRFRNQEKLGGEAGYYLSSLMGVIQFIETMDRTTLTISNEEYEKNVEAAVSAIAEKPQENEQATPPNIHIAEKSLPSRAEVTPRTSLEGEWSPPKKLRDGKGGSIGVSDEPMAAAGLLRSIQRPLSSIGRIFADENPRQPSSNDGSSLTIPARSASPRRSPARISRTASPNRRLASATDEGQTRSRGDMVAEDAAARQASAESAEAQRLQRLEHANVVETLSGMFPHLDKDVIDDVVRAKEGRVGLAVDACLALSS